MQTKIYNTLRWNKGYGNCSLLVGDYRTIINNVFTCVDVNIDVVTMSLKKDNFIVFKLFK
jgi:hypothetical protein